MPWMHLHVSTNGNVLPCCIADWTMPIGNLNNESFDSIWNNDNMREFRRNMLNDIPDKRCNGCYEKEKNGSWSQRIDGLHKYYNDSKEWVLNTEEDGTSQDSKPIFWDIRFSNICNMRCRMCGHFSSSRWFSDAKRLSDEYGDSSHTSGKNSVIIPAVQDSNLLLDRIEEFVPYLKEIYFAGGEPLIMDEHYRILEKIISLGHEKTKIRYNTNLSKLTYKNKNVIDLWNQFETVECVISVDSYGARGELIRKDCVWKEIEDNVRQIKKNAPHVKLGITPTVQILSVYSIPKLHLSWIEQGLIGPNNAFLNILTTPLKHNIKALPVYMKKEIEDIYNEYKQALLAMPDIAYNPILMTIDQMISYMNSEQMPEEYLNRFVKDTLNLDAIRAENTQDTFPELKYLWDNYPKD